MRLLFASDIYRFASTAASRGSTHALPLIESSRSDTSAPWSRPSTHTRFHVGTPVATRLVRAWGVTRGSHPGHSEEVHALAADATDLAMNESRARLLRGEGHPCARQSARLSGARAGMAQELATRAAARAQGGEGDSKRGVPRTGGICERLIVRQPHGAGTNIRVVNVPTRAYTKARHLGARVSGGGGRSPHGAGLRLEGIREARGCTIALRLVPELLVVDVACLRTGARRKVGEDRS